MDLVASLSRAKGPLELVSRRLNISGLFVLATVTVLVAAHIIVHRYNDAFIFSRIGAAVLAVLAAVVLNYSRCSNEVFELNVTISVMLWSSLLVWGYAALTADEFEIEQKGLCLMILQLYLLFSSLPLKLWCCLVGSHLFNVGMVCHWIGEPMSRQDIIAVTMLVLSVSCYAYHRRLVWTTVHNVLAEEREASNQLLAMICDAGFWLGADGDTIVRGDQRLNMIMRSRMDGRSFIESFEEAERPRFKAAVMQPLPDPGASPATSTSRASTRSTKGPAKLLHATLRRDDGSAVQADLLIVAAGPKLGFLIGLRLHDPLEAPESHVPGPMGISPPESFCEDAHKPLAHGCPPSRPLTPCDAIVVVERDEGDIELGSTVSAHQSLPATLVSRAVRETLQVQACGRLELSTTLLQAVSRRAMSSSLLLHDTLHGALSLCCDHATGGALVAIAPKSAFERVFGDSEADEVEDETSRGPSLRTSDGGYMTNRLRGLHVSDTHFAEAFQDFTRHTDTDRWPSDHPDPAARNQPKDGALLLDVSGFRLKCASKVSGLTAPTAWPGVGNRHETAMACAWAVDMCIVLVQSEGGVIHGIVRDGPILKVYRLQPEETESAV